MLENIDPAKLVDYIGHTNAALQKGAAAIEELAKIKQQQEKVASLIPAAVEAMASHGRINQDQRELATKALQDPVQTMQLLQKVAMHRNEKELATAIGKPVDDNFNKVAAAFSPIGARRNESSEADRQLFAAFGVTLTD